MVLNIAQKTLGPIDRYIIHSRLDQIITSKQTIKGYHHTIFVVLKKIISYSNKKIVLCSTIKYVLAVKSQSKTQKHM